MVGHGCYTNVVRLADIDFLQCLHGRAPAVATGVKRVQREAAVFTLQGDGDMASEGLAEILHAAARGERITCIMLNNGVFGDTGGQMTAATVVGQRTKTSSRVAIPPPTATRCRSPTWWPPRGHGVRGPRSGEQRGPPSSPPSAFSGGRSSSRWKVPASPSSRC